MSNFAIVDLVIPDSVDSENATDFLEMVEIRNAVALEQQGPDGVVSAEELLPRTKRTSDGERSWALVKIDGHVVGRAFCVTAFDSAAPEIEVTIEVLAAFRRRGIGTALLEWARETARSRGKTVLQAQVYMFPREGAPTISPSSGFGAIPADEPGSAFALRHGATLAQVQRGSALILPAPEVVLEPLYADAVKAAGNDYSLVLWTDRTPEQWEVDIAALGPACRPMRRRGTALRPRMSGTPNECESPTAGGSTAAGTSSPGRPSTTRRAGWWRSPRSSR
jgi:GNAT superfamily N-acetyltransferase